MLEQNNKEIIFIIGYLSNGGAERVVSVLANDFVEKGFNVSILTILGDNKQYELDSRINYIPLVSKYNNKIMRVLERIAFIRKNIKSVNECYVISFLAQINIYSIVSNIFNKSKLIVSERNDPYQDPTNKIHRKIRDFLYNFADGFVFQTEDAKNYFSKRIQSKSTIIPNPLKENLPEPFIGVREKKIVTAVRLEYQKNVKMLINSYYKIQKEYPEYILEIYGKGPLKEKLVSQCKELGIVDKVNFCGYSENLHNDILKAKIFVLPSNYEGISNSMIEALALGIPVVSTDHPIGGARMFIKPEFNGLLVNVNDCEATYRAIKRIIESDSLEEKFSKNAINIREDLNANKIANDWQKFMMRDDY